MPVIETDTGQKITCQIGDNLRSVLLRAGYPLYNGIAKAIHCRGMGTCGTCSLQVWGQVSKHTAVETWRLGFPPHRPSQNLRLACQTTVQGDLKIKKLAGLWGNKNKTD